MTSQGQTFKNHFPIFSNNPSLIYLDSAATAQKLGAVIDREKQFYEHENANVHRGLYDLSSRATQNFESVRSAIAKFIEAKSSNEIAFTKGTTESINIIANSFSSLLQPGDRVIVTVMEHHANFIPWQKLCEHTKAELVVIPIDVSGDLDVNLLVKNLNSETRMVAVTHVSNVLGTINPIDRIIAEAHRLNIPVLVDAAQSIGHMPVNVSAYEADFLAFSAHKMFGPMGVGVLYANEKFHDLIRPLNYGGGIVKEVTQEETSLLPFPRVVEGGTPNVAGVIATIEAIKFLSELDLLSTFKHGQSLAMKFREAIRKLGFVKVIGNPNSSSNIVAFIVDDIHPHDVSAFLADRNICVRAGHHCAQPLHKALNVPATVRASFSIYNDERDVDAVIDCLKQLKIFWS